MTECINKLMLLGNLTADPKFIEFEGGGKKCRFDIATSEGGYTKSNGEQVAKRTEYHEIVINNNGLVDRAKKILSKGTKVFIEGPLRTEEYTNKAGVKIKNKILVAEDFKVIAFANKKNEVTTEETAEVNDNNNGLPF